MRRFAAACSALLVAAALLLASAPAAAAAPPGWGTLTGTILGEAGCGDAGRPFADVPVANVHCDAVTWLRGAAITTPVGDRYRPAGTVTRGQMTAFLYRLVSPGQVDPVCGSRPFGDVPVDSTFCGTVDWARGAGIASGYGDGSFRPEAPVRRGEMALFLQRLHASVTPADALEPCAAAPFTDVAVGDTACAAVTWLRDAGVTAGFPDGSYRPAPGVSRAEMASFLWRMVTATGAFPGLPAVPLRPLPGATVLAGSGASVYLATSGADGGFTLDVPQGSYRLCADAGGVRVGAQGGYLDGCLGGVVWDYDLPVAPDSAPSVPVTAGANIAGLRVALSIAPADRAGRRGPLVTPAVRDSRYAFMSVAGSTAVTYSSCSPIHFVIRPDGAPAGGHELIMAAITRLSQVTGLRFIYDGTSTETPTSAARAAYQPARYGQRWAPVLIGWSDAGENPGLAGTVVGFAGSDVRIGTHAATGVRTPTLTSGVVVLDAPDLAGLMATRADAVRAVILHELAHLVGLDHVGDPSQLLYPELTSVVDYAAGDLSGLALAGSGPCVTLPDPATDTRALQLPGEGADGIRYGTAAAVE